MKQTNQHLNLVTTIQVMTNSQVTANLKNCKIKNPSCLFQPLAQYLGSIKQRALSLGITNVCHSISHSLCPAETLTMADLSGWIEWCHEFVAIRNLHLLHWLSMGKATLASMS